MYGDFCVAAAHSSCLLLPVVTLGARRRPPHYSNNMDETREKQHTGALVVGHCHYETIHLAYSSNSPLNAIQIGSLFALGLNLRRLIQKSPHAS
jgi:hypothetical protein